MERKMRRSKYLLKYQIIGDGPILFNLEMLLGEVLRIRALQIIGMETYLGLRLQICGILMVTMYLKENA